MPELTIIPSRDRRDYLIYWGTFLAGSTCHYGEGWITTYYTPGCPEGNKVSARYKTRRAAIRAILAEHGVSMEATCKS